MVRNYWSTCDIRRVTQRMTCYFKALLLQALLRPNDMYCHNKEFKFPAVHCFLKSYCSFRYCDSSAREIRTTTTVCVAPSFNLGICISKTTATV